MSVRKKFWLNCRINDEQTYEQVEALFSGVPAHNEVVAETFSFTLPERMQVTFDLTIPIVTYHYVAPPVGLNGACRVYLDGTGWNSFPGGAKQWNSPGGALAGGGQWNTDFATPINGRLNTSYCIELDAGAHILRTHLAASDVRQRIKLQGPRMYQVWSLETY